MDDASFSEDIQLWEQLLKGDRNALSQLFRKYYTPLLNYGLKLIGREDLVKDSIQELFFVIWEQRKGLSEVEYVRSYLYLSFRRTIFRTNEVRNVRNRRDINYSRESIKEVTSQEQLMIMNELKQEQEEQLVEALGMLSQRQQEAMFLKFYNGLSNEEIAQVMNINKQSVYNHICCAIEALKELLNG